ncbi:hypothetical protein LB505_003411 [Fusarium chuoi]|nr:hypothetical protein LB505_003411 [Fusarium chuoi]
MGYTNCTLSRGKLHQHGLHREALDAALQGHGSYCGQTQILISNIVSRGVLTTSEYHYDEISTHYANIPHITCLSLLRLARRWSGGAWGAGQSHLRGGYHINWSQGYAFSKEGKRDIACYETPYSSRDIHKENLLTDPGSFQDGPISSPGSPRYPMERYQRRCLP